jgi:hypothetical protein
MGRDRSGNRPFNQLRRCSERRHRPFSVRLSGGPFSYHASTTIAAQWSPISSPGGRWVVVYTTCPLLAIRPLANALTRRKLFRGKVIRSEC